MLKNTRSAALHTFERRMVECAPWVGTDRCGADALVTALLDSAGYDAHWPTTADFGGDPREDAPTVAAKYHTPAAVADREIQGFRSMVSL